MSAPANHFDETLFAFAPDAILLVDKNGAIVKLNPQAEQLFGYTSTELAGERIECLLPMRYRHAHVALREGYGEAPRTRRMGTALNLWAQRKDGGEFAVEVALGPQQHTGTGELLVLCVVRDISERQRAQQALQDAHDLLERRVLERTQELSEANSRLSSYAQQLERSNRELQDFAYVASHDLQEPLRKIQAFGERLQQGLGESLEPRLGDYLARMRNAAGRMQKLINNLLTFSRVTTRAQPFQTISLDHVLDEALLDLELRIEESKARIERAPLGDIQADPMQMRQLLQNLLSNALKFRAPDRAHTVSVSARRFAAEGNDWCELRIVDNGIGFESRFAEKSFGLFQRLHARDEHSGSGVGLAICRKIAERHGGRISADGELGRGATFTVLLPAQQRETS